MRRGKPSVKGKHTRLHTKTEDHQEHHEQQKRLSSADQFLIQHAARRKAKRIGKTIQEVNAKRKEANAEGMSLEEAMEKYK